MNPLQSVDKRVLPYATALLQAAFQLSSGVHVTSAKRSIADQRRLYAAYVAGRSKYPAAAPGSSKHETGRAFDIGGLSSSQLAQLGALWESWGGRWGGNFRAKDEIHFEV